MVSGKEFENGNATQNGEEEIPVEEEEMPGADEKAADWADEFVVAGEELVEAVMELVREASVRRIVVKNESGRVLLEIPLVLGVAGIALAPLYASLGLIAALVTECTIAVERAEPEAEEEAA